MYRRHKLEDEEESHERWLISYADFITLLFAFFVVMYATSNINLNKYRALSSSVVTAFQGQPGAVGQPQNMPQGLQTPGLPVPGAQNQNGQVPSAVMKPLPLSYLYQEKKQRDQEKIRAMAQQLANTLAQWIEQKQIMVYQSDLGVEMDISTHLLFQNNQAAYTPQASQILHIISAQLKNEYRTLQVEGHSDKHTFSGMVDAESKRWTLTATQAARVAATLAADGIAAKRLSALGLAETRPVSSSDNNLAQSLNSRITLRILTAEAGEQLTTNLANRQEVSPAEPEATAEIPTMATPATLPSAMTNKRNSQP